VNDVTKLLATSIPVETLKVLQMEAQVEGNGRLWLLVTRKLHNTEKKEAKMSKAKKSVKAKDDGSPKMLAGNAQLPVVAKADPVNTNPVEGTVAKKGEKGGSRQVYSPELREKAVGQLKAGKSVQEVSDDLKVGYATVQYWKSAAGLSPKRGAGKKSAPKAAPAARAVPAPALETFLGIKDGDRELQLLKLENEYLKKRLSLYERS